MPNYMNPAAFEQVYEKYFRRVYNFVFFRLLHREKTEDVVSQVFMKVFEGLQNYDMRKGSLDTWIFTIARNTLTDFYRLRKPAFSLDDERHQEPSVDFEEQCNLIADEELRELYMALTQLDERTRTVLTLKYFGTFTNREIAAQTGINESTVSTLCCRGVAKLQTILDPRECEATQGNVPVTFRG